MYYPLIIYRYLWIIHDQCIDFWRVCMHNLFFGIFWWSLGVSGVTWGSSEGNQRSFLIGFRMIFGHFFDILLVDPGSIQESFCFFTASIVARGTMLKSIEVALTPSQQQPGGRHGTIKGGASAPDPILGQPGEHSALQNPTTQAEGPLQNRLHENT